MLAQSEYERVKAQPFIWRTKIAHAQALPNGAKLNDVKIGCRKEIRADQKSKRSRDRRSYSIHTIDRALKAGGVRYPSNRTRGRAHLGLLDMAYSSLCRSELNETVCISVEKQRKERGGRRYAKRVLICDRYTAAV